MHAFKLEKDITLYKSQFDKFNLNRTGGVHELDRTSLELDSLLFRTKYMIRKKKDLDKIDDIKGEFTEKALHLRDLFNEFLYDFLAQIVTIPEGFHLEDIHDVFAQDVKIDTVHVKFNMILISPNKDYLKYADNAIPEDEPYNMFPNEFFRYQTDSYNDAIAKAYPELFENRHQDVVGVGADGDVFTHNLTFQTSERCSLNCTYCYAAGTKILMADGTEKNIEDISVGDMILGFDEKFKPLSSKADIKSRVTHVFHRKSEVVEIKHSYLRDIYVTPDHPIASSTSANRGKFIKAEDLRPDKNPLYQINISNKSFSPLYSYTKKFDPNNIVDVYNIETECHTYIANSVATHNCYQFNKSPMRMEFDTAKEFIDNLVADKYGYINRYNSPAIIIEFIGGEPLLEIKLTRQIYEYFLDRCYELNHPWFSLHRVSICSNGLQYFDKDVQEFFKDYASNISFNISIDGNKDLHDSCRIQPNGEGSYDVAMAALNHFNKHYTAERNSKMTLAPSNIKYLFDSVVDFINNGMKCINLNCIFEEGWNQETARLEYDQLKKLADYILDNNLENIYIAIFNDRQEDMMDKYSDSSSCFKAGTMVLGENGSVPIETIKTRDILYTASGSKHVVSNMTKYHSTDNKILRVTGSYKIHCTSDHKVFAKKFLYMGWKGVIHYSEPGFYPVSELKKGDRIALPLLDLSNNKPNWIDLPTAYAIGLFLADGYINKNYVHITPGYDTDKYYYNALINAGLSVRESEQRTSMRYTIGRNDSPINERFFKVCQSCGHLAHNKHFPRIIFESPEDIIRECIRGYIDKDGYTVSRKESSNYGLVKTNSVSMKMMNDLIILLRSLGEYPTCYHYKRAGKMKIEGRTVNVRDRYEVYYNPLKPNNHNMFKLDDKFRVMWAGLQSIEDDPEDYDVYCPTVVPGVNNDSKKEEHTIIANSIAALNCGGDGSMLAIRPNGQLYPCIRYMPTSVGDNVEDLCIGSVQDGFIGRKENSSVLSMMDKITRRSQTNDICFECPLSNDCAACLALGHTVFGTPNKRCSFICIQMIAEALANIFYWNNLLLKHPEWDLSVRRNVVPDEWALLVIDKEELYNLKLLETAAMIKYIEYHSDKK